MEQLLNDFPSYTLIQGRRKQLRIGVADRAALRARSASQKIFAH